MPPAPPRTPPGASAEGACALFRAKGWREVGQGDWCWVFADPEDRQAARVTPWDPAYRLHVEICQAHPDNPFLQRIDELIDLPADGHVVLMERLWPADPETAVAFCHAVGQGNDSGWGWTKETPRPFPETPDLTALRAILAEERDRGAATLPFWGGSDVSPKNVMADAHGQLKLIDPFYVSGWKIVEAIERGSPELTTRMTWPELQAFFTIPRALENPDDGALLRKAEELFRAAGRLKPV